MIKLSLAVIVTALTFSGCATDDTKYYSAMQEQQKLYTESYNTIKNESVSFDGNFTGKITIIKPKKLPQFQPIIKPRSTSQEALAWGQMLIPAATMITGSYFNYKMTDSSNKYNSENIKSWTGNFENTSVTNTTSEKSSDVANTTSTTSTTSTNDVPTVDIKDGNVSLAK